MTSAVDSSQNAIKAAMSVAREVAEGHLDPDALDTEFAAAAREQLGRVIGPSDDQWELQLDIARAVLAAGGIPTAELAEWLAVQRRREGEDDGSERP
jgi:hypothetical protein